MFRALSNNFHQWRAYRSSVNKLSRLSMRELDDVGFSQANTGSIGRAYFG
ncbi:MAG: DUF1127 domain-containing protein [Cohaesibacteraceae bacterium]|nr:DUF1127 domain-containing protein [Cohaesibacteraceae bacterium]